MHAQLSPATGWTTGPVFQWDGWSSESLDPCPARHLCCRLTLAGRSLAVRGAAGMETTF